MLKLTAKLKFLTVEKIQGENMTKNITSALLMLAAAVVFYFQYPVFATILLGLSAAVQSGRKSFFHFGVNRPR